MNKRLVVCLFLAVILLVACSSPGNSTSATLPTSTNSEAVQATATQAPATPTATETLVPATETSTPAPTATLTPTPVAYGPDNFPANINPLTGLQADANLLKQRPFSIKVNIHPSFSRPPWGLNLADIVYEYYHQEGATRFNAFFHGKDADLIGPIRSGRLLDDSLVQMYHSIFVYGHADPVIDYFFHHSPYSDRLIVERWAETLCPPTGKIPLCRFDPQGKDLMLTGTKALAEYAAAHKIDNSPQNLNGMSFNAAQPQSGQPGLQVTSYYSFADYNRWEYDAKSGRYLRFQDNAWEQGKPEAYAPLIDRLDNQQIAADNVVVILANHRNYSQPGQNQIVEITLSGTGTAYAFRDGNVYKLNWNVPNINSVLYLTNPDGSRFPFKPGTTWFQVVDTNAKIDQQENGAWRFTQKFH